jgi:hypothetical protein
MATSKASNALRHATEDFECTADDKECDNPALEPEIAEALARHEHGDYRLGEESQFWQDFALKLRDALTPNAERLWRDDYPDDSLAAEGDRRRLNKAIERAAPIANASNLDISPLLWLRRYINGEIPRDVEQVRAVQDLVAALTLAATDKLGEHYWLPELPAEQTAARGADTKTDKQKKLPRNPEIVKAAQFVRQQRDKVQRKGTPEPSLIDILSEYTGGNRKTAESLRRALQPSRYGWLLELSADK